MFLTISIRIGRSGLAVLTFGIAVAGALSIFLLT